MPTPEGPTEAEMLDAAEKADARSPRYNRRREDILNRAADVFNRVGVRGATLADVAAEVGVNLTSIRHYFPRREDLVAASVERSLGLTARLIEGARDETTSEQRVRKFVSLHFAARRQIREGVEPDVIHFADMRSMRSPHSERVWPLYNDNFRRYRSLVATPEEIASDRQRINARAQVLVTQIHRSLTWLPEYDLSDFAAVEARFIDILLNGLSPDAPAWAPQTVELAQDDKQDKRSLESFLHAATQLINQQGFRGASITRVAEKLNVTKGSFYHHADAKGDLLAACGDRTVRIISNAQAVALASQTRGLDQALTATASLVRLQQTPDGALLRSSALASVEPAMRQDITRRLDVVSHRFADMISDGIVDGSVRPCNSRVGGHMLMALIHSAEEVSRWVPNVDEGNVVDLYVRPMFKGLFA